MSLVATVVPVLPSTTVVPFAPADDDDELTAPPYFCILLTPLPLLPIVPNTPKPNNNPNNNANNAKIPNIGHNQPGHPSFFYFFTLPEDEVFTIGPAYTFEPLFDTFAV